MSTKFGRYIVLVLFIASTLFTAAANPMTGKGAVCPPGNVKWETFGGYEYSDDSATVTGNWRKVTWEAAEGYTITGVCIKIGGKHGGKLIDGLAEGGGPFRYGISHVVITTEPIEEEEKENDVKKSKCLACGDPLREVIPLGYEGMKIWYNDVGCDPECGPKNSRIHIIYRDIPFKVWFSDGEPPLEATETRVVEGITYYVIDVPSLFYTHVTDMDGESIGWKAYNYIACSVWPDSWSFTETADGILAIRARGQWKADWIDKLRDDYLDRFDSNASLLEWVDLLFVEGQLLLP
ncbi:hypothetical protein HN803_06020 [candidate division WWE3 bacterium]|jgi:hypothetical protein|nr:hypothetical protein [candidate division WWE3 bacterium]MBT7350312.1 hypothetical protein [candidate division WWE3 bacterium]